MKTSRIVVFVVLVFVTSCGDKKENNVSSDTSSNQNHLGQVMTKSDGSLEPSAALNMIYQAILFRLPRPSEIAAESRAIEDNGIDAMKDLAVRLVRGPFQFRIFGKVSPNDIVTNIYQTMFRRNPEEGGLNAYSQLVGEGRMEEAILSIINSREFAKKNLGQRGPAQPPARQGNGGNNPGDGSKGGGSNDGSVDNCPKEADRGWGFLYVNRGRQRFCTGYKECMHSEIRVGDNIVLDSTPRTRSCDHYPDGRQLCEFPRGCPTLPTRWMTPGLETKPDGEYGLEVRATRPGTYQVTACPPNGAPGTCTTKPIVVR